jgi:RNA-directed DNA polymerase
MTVSERKPLTGAALSDVIWKSINWKTINAEVRRLQMRIAKAVREGRHGKVKSLQWLLTHSFSAKLLAVDRVVKNGTVVKIYFIEKNSVKLIPTYYAASPNKLRTN